jgi:FixJ family two-component response regulator
MPTASGAVAIVEDDAAMRRSIERLLRASSYATVAFASAEDFLASAAVDTAMALVLDIHLGGMSGIGLRRHLSAAGSTIPVVFITAFDDDATRAEAIATGCIDYLQKPFDASRLIQALERLRMRRDQ